MGVHSAPHVPELWPTWLTWSVVVLLIAAFGTITGTSTAVDVGRGSPWWALNLAPAVITYRLFFRHPLPMTPTGSNPIQRSVQSPTPSLSA